MSQRSYVEIHQQAGADTGELHVGKYLRCMNGEQPLDRLYLHNESSLDQHVEAVATVYDEPLIFDGHGSLPLESKSKQPQFPAKAGLVGDSSSRFEQTATE